MCMSVMDEEQFERLTAVLSRIAEALEEQNKYAGLNAEAYAKHLTSSQELIDKRNRVADLARQVMQDSLDNSCVRGDDPVAPEFTEVDLMKCIDS